MSSTNKTSNLGLNSWLGSDIPSREDFNNDNKLIDTAITEHSDNKTVHITASERATWNMPYTMITYYGNGASNRTLSLGIDYTPSFGFVFAVSNPPAITDFENNANYNYFGLASSRGSTMGLTISGTQLKIQHSSVASIGDEYRNFNENGITYIVVMFR